MEITIIPYWFIKKFHSEYKIQNEINILISNILIIILFTVFNHSIIDVMNSIPHFCLFDKITGLECPVCGTTRAFCEIATGNINHAYQLNFSSIIVAGYFIAQLPLRIITLYDNNLIPTINSISRFLSYSILYFILIAWIFKLFI